MPNIDDLPPSTQAIQRAFDALVAVLNEHLSHMKHPRILLVALLLAFLPTAAPAQSISLTPAQCVKLRSIVQSDAEAGALYARLHRAADEALAAEPNPVAQIEAEGKLKRTYQAGSPFQPKTAVAVLQLAELFDPTLLALEIKLAKPDAKLYPTWQSVLNAARR